MTKLQWETKRHRERILLSYCRYPWLISYKLSFERLLRRTYNRKKKEQ